MGLDSLVLDVSKPNGNPSALTLTVLSDTSIKCDWTNGATNQDGTYIYISTDNVNFINNATAFGSLTTKTLTGLIQNTTYYIKVVHYKASKLSEYSNTADSLTFTTEFQTILNNLSTTPSAKEKADQNLIVKRIVDANIWSDLDFLFCFANHSENDSLRNWISPATILAQNIHSTVWTKYEGYTGDGGSDYIKTGVIPSLCAKYSLDSASLGVYLRKTNATTKIAIGTQNNNANSPSYIFPLYLTDFTISANNASALVKTPNSKTTGFFAWSRNSSSEVKMYQNKNEVTKIQNSGALSNREWYILAFNNDGSTAFNSPNQIAFAFAGAKLTQTKINAIQDAIGEYMDSCGKAILNLNFEGDSLTNCSGASVSHYWAKQVRDNYLPSHSNLLYNEFGHNGDSTLDLISQYATSVKLEASPTELDVIVAWEDVNAILNNGRTALQNFNDMVTYFTNCKNDGFNIRILILGYYPRMVSGAYPAAWTADRLQAQHDYFEMAKAATDVPWTDIIDLRDDSIIGGARDQNKDSTYFGDWVHLTDAGYSRISPYVISIINQYL